MSKGEVSLSDTTDPITIANRWIEAYNSSDYETPL
jgi:hypothetical protein